MNSRPAGVSSCTSLKPTVESVMTVMYNDSPKLQPSSPMYPRVPATVIVTSMISKRPIFCCKALRAMVSRGGKLGSSRTLPRSPRRRGGTRRRTPRAGSPSSGSARRGWRGGTPGRSGRSGRGRPASVIVRPPGADSAAIRIVRFLGEKTLHDALQATVIPCTACNVKPEPNISAGAA